MNTAVVLSTTSASFIFPNWNYKRVLPRFSNCWHFSRKASYLVFKILTNCVRLPFFTKFFICFQFLQFTETSDWEKNKAPFVSSRGDWNACLAFLGGGVHFLIGVFCLFVCFKRLPFKILQSETLIAVLTLAAAFSIGGLSLPYLVTHKRKETAKYKKKTGIK